MVLIVQLKTIVILSFLKPATLRLKKLGFLSLGYHSPPHPLASGRMYNMHIEMLAKAEVCRKQYFIKTPPFSMHYYSTNEQFYPKLGSDFISFRKFAFLTVILGH